MVHVVNKTFSQRMYTTYSSWFWRVLVIAGIFVALYDIFENIEALSLSRLSTNLVMLLVIPALYFTSTKKSGISQYWRYRLMWIMIFLQITLAIYSRMGR